jgi:multidrug efflux pump subunit AcrB
LREARPFKRGPFAWFNKALDSFKGFFVSIAKWLASRIFLSFVLLLLTILLTVHFFSKTETSFLPDEDQSVVFCSMEMPEGTARDRSRETALRAVELLRTIPEVQSVLSITGWGMVGGRGENQTTLVVDLNRWDKRPDADQHVSKMIPKIQAILQSVPEPKWQVFAPPAIPGLGNANGISVHIQDKVGTDAVKLDELKKVLLAKLNANPKILAAFAGYNAETPKLRFNLDRTKAEMFHVPVATVYATLELSRARSAVVFESVLRYLQR